MSANIEKKPLEQLLSVAKAVAQGDFSKEVDVDTSGIIAQLAGEINNTVRILRNATPAFTQTTDQAPILANTAQSILELMGNSTNTTLDSADMIINACDDLDKTMAPKPGKSLDTLNIIKEKALDIIAAQSYQDSARQKLVNLEQDLEKIRNSMIEALIVMKLRSGEDPETLINKQQMLIEVTQGKSEEKKQDLVDQLLAEFGL